MNNIAYRYGHFEFYWALYISNKIWKIKEKENYLKFTQDINPTPYREEELWTDSQVRLEIIGNMSHKTLSYVETTKLIINKM